MVKRGLLEVMCLVLVLTSGGCGCDKGKVHNGESIQSNVEVVKLKEIIEDPDKYKDKEVVLEGNYGNYCCASDFVYKEGAEAVEVYPNGFPTPKLDRGKPIRVYGIVRSIEKKEGVKEESEEGDEKEEKEEEHHEVYIEAKEVAVK